MKITTVSTSALFGILPLMLLPALPDMLCIGVIFGLAILLCLISHSPVRFAGLTLLFFFGEFRLRKMRCGPVIRCLQKVSRPSCG